MIAIELSTSWGQILAGQIPEAVDIFFIAWLHRGTGKFAGCGCYLSTSEPSPHVDCDAYVAAHTRVNVNDRTAKGLEYTLKKGVFELSEVVLRDTMRGKEQLISPEGGRWTMEQFRNKLTEDMGGPKPSLPVEVVSDAEFKQLLKEGV